MKKLNQNGFSPFELILLVLVVALLGFSGYVVYHNNKPAQTTTENQPSEKVKTKTYTDTAKKFTVEYPVTWEAFNPDEGGKDSLGDKPIIIPDWTVTSRQVAIKPLTGTKDNNIRIMPGCEPGIIADRKANKDRFHTQADLKINGYEALYDKIDFKGDAESYLDHSYYVISGTNCLVFNFRENWHHDMSNTNFDDKQNFPGFESIVKSVKFTP